MFDGARSLVSPTRHYFVQEISQLTRGESLDSTDAADVVSVPPGGTALPEPNPDHRRLQLWAHPVWAGFLVLLLGVFWAGRKAAGMF